MKRRQFLFRTLKASLLLRPVLSIRQAEAQSIGKPRVFFFVEGGSYPFPEDFFPAQAGTAFTLPGILADFEDLKADLVIVDGINTRESGPDPKGNNHIRAMGKVLTAKDVIERSNGKQYDGLPGGISMDQVIAGGLGVKSLELLVEGGHRSDMRSRPFASGPGQFKRPIVNPAEAWDLMFNNFLPPAQQVDPAAKAARIKKLTAEKSLLDDLLPELARLRTELDGIEKLKLDIHEDAIRKAEKSVAAAISAAESGPPPAPICVLPQKVDTFHIPDQAKAHFDLLFAAFACERIGVGGMIFGFSSIQWHYSWLGFNLPRGNIHDDVYHKADSERAKQIQATRWNMAHLAGFIRRLKATPDGEGTMLGNMLIYSTSHFGRHHQLNQLPVLLAGGAQGRLRTGRSLKVRASNAKILTSVAKLCGVNVNGIGDEPDCGPLTEL